MRDDFNRVLTEDPRRGSRNKFSQYRRDKGNASFDDEFSGGKESMMKRRRIANGERKTFGDLLGPLEGWVRKQVGRKWNDVYSELCTLFDKRSVIKNHVHEHVFNNFVETNTAMIDGKACVMTYHGWAEIATVGWMRRRFYVHPATGVLSSADSQNEPGNRERKEREKAEKIHAVFRVHDKNTHLFFVDGLWWAYTLDDVPPPRLEYRCPWWRPTDLARWELMTLAEREREGTPVWVNTNVRTLGVQDPEVVRIGWRIMSMLPAGKYYSARRVANKKILKKHGLIGTNKAKDGATPSHREMSKYR